METMRIREKKKKSYKLQIFFIMLFVIIGGSVIYIGMKNENNPSVIGSNKNDINSLKNIDQEVVPVINTLDNKYTIEKNIIKDSNNKKVKCNMTLPIISVNDVKLDKVNNEINEKYTSTFNTFKEQKSENSFTYNVTYNEYRNTINNIDILTITIYEKMVDDHLKKNSMEKINAINIDLSTGEVINIPTILSSVLGETYKETIRNKIKDYLLSKNYTTEDEFIYVYTGLEVYYFNNGKLHIVFNPDNIVDKKYGIIDLEVN